MVRYCNSYWFVLSDKNFVLYEADSLMYALGFYARANLSLLFSRIRQAVEPNKGVKPKNVRNMIFLCRGAVKAARIIGGEVGEVEERRIEI